DYFRREVNTAWWEYYRLHELEHDDLLDERKAITGLEFVEALPTPPRQRVPVHRYRYPPQEITIDVDDRLVEVRGEDIGTVCAIALDQNIIDIKKAGKAADNHPRAVHVNDVVKPDALASSLMELARKIDDDGLAPTWPHAASKDLLMKRAPRLVEGKSLADCLSTGDLVASAIDIALNLHNSILPIQGPPGAGKTYTGAQMILALLKAGKRVGVTAVSHS